MLAIETVFALLVFSSFYVMIAKQRVGIEPNAIARDFELATVAHGNPPGTEAAVTPTAPMQLMQRKRCVPIHDPQEWLNDQGGYIVNERGDDTKLFVGNFPEFLD